MPENAGAHDCVGRIWRYPVKSMAGEELACARVTSRGLLGDRVYALVEKAPNRVAAARTWAAALFSYCPRFVTEPEPGAPPPAIRITMPDGRTLSTTDAAIDAHFSATFGRNLTLMTAAPAGLLVEFSAGTLGGALIQATELRLACAAPPGTFFDYACIHLITTSTIDRLQEKYPQGRFDVRRFRPNLVIQSAGKPFIENSWAGRKLAVGNDVVLRASMPGPRCVITTLPQGDLAHDPGILRTIAQENRHDLGYIGELPCAGVYADVVKPGTIRQGDAVHCVD